MDSGAESGRGGGLASDDGSGRRHAEQLERRDAIFACAVNFAIVATDLDGRVTDWNPGAENVLGWTADEMLGRPIHAIFTPEDRAAGRPETEMRLALEEGRASDERWHVRQTGDRFWASGEMLPLRAPGGARLGYVKILRDRTAEHQAAEALRETEARLRENEDHLRHTVDLSPQVPWTCDPQGSITSYSQRWLDLTGQTPGEPDGAGWLKVVHPDDVEPTVVAFSACLRSGEPVDVDYRIKVAPTGAYRWMRARAHPRRDAAGAIVRWYGVVEDVHDRKGAEAALRESEIRYRTLFEAIDLGFCVIDMVLDPSGQAQDYRFVETNPVFQRQAGFKPVPGQRMREIAPNHEQHWFDVYGRVARTGEPAFFQDHSDQLGRWWDVHAFRVGDPALNRVGVLFTDITDRRHDERALRESEARFRTFAQAMPNHVWSASPDGKLEWANEPTYVYSGRAADGTIGDSWTSRVHPDDLARVGARWASSLATGATYETEFRVRRADGVYRWFLVRALPVRGADGAIERWIGANTDIDDQRSASEALAHLNATLEQEVAQRTRERNRLWETTNDLVGTGNLTGYLQSVNPAWRSLLGWTDEELLARPFIDFVHEADHASAGDIVAALAAGETVTGYVDRVKARDGSLRTVMWTAVPALDEGLFYMVGRDLTEQRAAEEALRHSQKMEAVGQLTGGIAHDFNNLLAGITGSLEIMQTRMTQGRISDLDRYMTAAQGAARRAAALTHRLLAFSRRQTLDPRPTDVNRLVSGLEELIRRTVGPAVAIEVVGASGLWSTLVDPGQLENALLNLCINARDAMPDGGRLTVETGNRWMDRRAAQDRDLPPGQYVSLCVSDTGTGMAPEIVAKAFDPFFTTKPIGQGTGLGLSMIYGFARQSGGQARIYSEVGQGTMVCLYLPRHLGPAETADAPPELAAAPRAGADETVLVVDDEPTVRMLVTEVLEELGYAAIEAADGPSGLKVLQSDVRIDLLVSDVGLPGGMNGRQMADAARVSRPDLKVLFITGYAENAVVGNGHLEHGMHVMTKPFAMEALASRIRELIGEGHEPR